MPEAVKYTHRKNTHTLLITVHMVVAEALAEHPATSYTTQTGLVFPPELPSQALPDCVTGRCRICRQ